MTTGGPSVDSVVWSTGIVADNKMMIGKPLEPDSRS